MTDTPTAVMPSGRLLLRAIKLAARPLPPTLCVPVGKPVEALLRPVATGAAVNDADVGALTAWRNRFVRSFLTEFEANEARTAGWLREQVARDDGRILFMVDAAGGETIGYMGLAFIDWERGSGELDAFVRGRPAAPGLMERALHALFGWAWAQLGLVALGARVRSDNPALGYFRKVGFVEERRVPLRRREEPGMVTWLEDDELPPGEPSLVYIRWLIRESGGRRPRAGGSVEACVTPSCTGESSG